MTKTKLEQNVAGNILAFGDDSKDMKPGIKMALAAVAFYDISSEFLKSQGITVMPFQEFMRLTDEEYAQFEKDMLEATSVEGETSFVQ